ncbi:MAG: hypothetical protein LC802_21045, partial [Acidobacteria bacterium]|nr:hypothetical protein [Acidobacteriota bacterium]
FYSHIPRKPSAISSILTAHSTTHFNQTCRVNSSLRAAGLEHHAFSTDTPVLRLARRLPTG